MESGSIDLRGFIAPLPRVESTDDPVDIGALTRSVVQIYSTQPATVFTLPDEADSENQLLFIKWRTTLNPYLEDSYLQINTHDGASTLWLGGAAHSPTGVRTVRFRTGLLLHCDGTYWRGLCWFDFAAFSVT